MLFFVAVLAVVSAAVLLFSYLLLRARDAADPIPAQNDPPSHLRPLFEPSDDEMKAFEREESARVEADAQKLRADELEQKTTEINGRISEFSASPNKKDTIELMRLAATHGDARTFSAAASEILRVFGEGRIDGLSADDLAALLDSHYRLLPQMERASGELFWLKQEIAGLGSQPLDR